jgi:hypothetical protein
LKSGVRDARRGNFDARIRKMRRGKCKDRNSTGPFRQGCHDIAALRVSGEVTSNSLEHDKTETMLAQMILPRALTDHAAGYMLVREQSSPHRGQGNDDKLHAQPRRQQNSERGATEINRTGHLDRYYTDFNTLVEKSSSSSVTGAAMP